MSSRIRSGEEDSEDDHDSAGEEISTAPEATPATFVDSGARRGEEREGEERGGEGPQLSGLISPQAEVSALSSALFTGLQGHLEAVHDRLLELQEAQHMLVTTVTLQRSKLADDSSEWQNAKSVLDRIPEYLAKVQRIKRTMQSTQSQIMKVDKTSTTLRTKLEDKERERAARRTADASAYSSVSAK